MAKEPYIGVTGLTSADEAKQLSELFHGVPKGTKGMAGILISYKDLEGRHGTINENYRARYPGVEKLPGILENLEEHVMPTIHYNTKGNFQEELENILGYCVDLGVEGVQLNVNWPDLEKLDDLKAEFPYLDVIISVSKTARGWRSAEEAAEKAKSYSGKADYFLWDMSGGRGQQIDVDEALRFYHSLGDLPVVFAGGLHGRNVYGIVWKLKEGGAKNFSIDAEGNLLGGNGKLNMDNVRNYLKAAAAGYRR